MIYMQLHRAQITNNNHASTNSILLGKPNYIRTTWTSSYYICNVSIRTTLLRTTICNTSIHYKAIILLHITPHIVMDIIIP